MAMTLRRGTASADAELNETLKRLDNAAQTLDGFEKKVGEKVKGNHAAIEKGKGVIESLHAMGTGILKGPELVDQLSTSQGNLFLESARLFKLFEMLYANFTVLLHSEVDAPLDKYLSIEVEAVKYQKKKFEKASQALESSTQRINHAKAAQAKAAGKMDIGKVAEAEQDYARTKQKFERARLATQAAVQDASDAFCIYSMQSMFGFFDAAADFFHRGNQSFTDFRPKLEATRQQLKERRAAFTGPSKGTRDCDIHKSGWVEKMADKGKGWSQRWAVLKYRYLYLYEKSELKSLKTVIHLRGCHVSDAGNAAGKKPYCLSIKTSDRECVLAFKTKQEQDAWAAALPTCIMQQVAPSVPTPQDSATASPPSSPKGSYVGSAVPASVQQLDRMRSSSGRADPQLEAFKTLLIEEKGYVQTLNTIVTIYVFPLRDSALLKEEVGDELLLFSNVEMIWLQHREILADLQAMMEAWSSEKNFTNLAVGRICGPSLELYNRYLANFPTALVRLDKLQRTSKAFEAFVKRGQSMSNEGEELEVLLSYPLNRILQYKRFLEQATAAAPPGEPVPVGLSGAATLLKQLCDSVAETNRQAEEIASLISWGKKLDYDGLVSTDRRFVKEGSSALVIDGMRTDVLLFVFTDFILWSRKQGLIGRLKDKYKVDGRINLQKSNIRDTDSSSFTIMDSTGKQYVLTLPSSAEKEEWKKVMQDLVQELLNGRGVFGVPLQVLMNSGRQKGHDIPIFVERALAFLSSPNVLQAEGLFRLSGQQTTIDSIKEALDSGKDVDFSSSTDVHVVTGLLKLWFREMPEPVFTWGLYDAFVQAAGTSNDTRPLSARLDAVRAVLKQLPPPNRYLVQALFKFLRKVSEKSLINKMATKNIAIVFGPNLLSKRAGSTAGGANQLLNDMGEAYEVVMILIDNYEAIFADIEKERMLNQGVTRKQEEEAQHQQKEQREQYFSSLPSRADIPRSAKPQEEDVAPGEIVKEGWLEKKGKNRRNWKTRFFKLRYKFLNYYASPLDEVPLGRIKLVNCQVGTSSNRPFCFMINTPDREFLVAARSEEEKAEWMQAILPCIEGFEVLGIKPESKSRDLLQGLPRSPLGATPGSGPALLPASTAIGGSGGGSGSDRKNTAPAASGTTMIANPAFNAVQEVVNPAFAAAHARRATDAAVRGPPVESSAGPMLHRLGEAPALKGFLPGSNEEADASLERQVSPTSRATNNKSNRTAVRLDYPVVPVAGGPGGPTPTPSAPPPAPVAPVPAKPAVPGKTLPPIPPKNPSKSSSDGARPPP